jgi:hypothetical protein
MNKEALQSSLDVTAPEILKATQQWFARIITNPLQKDDAIQPISPNGTSIAKEAAHHILPRPQLRPHKRIEIYNQQYWWRLLKAMQENFPLVTRLFGRHAFNNTIATPYLVKYPPNHWSLTTMGERLLLWIEEDYKAPDKELVKNAVALDWAFLSKFLAPRLPPLDLSQANEQEELLSYTFFLQPHIALFQWNCDMMTFRESFLAHDIDHWTEHDFPHLAKDKTYQFVLYRTAKNFIARREISLPEFILLSKLQGGCSIEAACDELEQRGEEVFEEASQNLQNWIQDWVSRGWLTTKNISQVRQDHSNTF